MAALENIVSRNLQCPVCLELLSDPKQLSCTHTFCKKCLKDILICSAHKSISCPICRNITAVNGGDVMNLKTNVLIKSFVDDLRNSKQLCEVCDSNKKATHFCCDCGKNMCKACLENHNNWPSNLNHKIVSVEDLREGRVALEKTVYCQEHPTESIKRRCTDVCITCKKFICERCRLIDHKDHKVQSADEYNTSTRKQIESQQARGRTKVATVKTHRTYVDDQKKRVTDHLDNKKAEINNIRQESIKKINERWAVLDKKIETQRVTLCKRLDEMTNADERLVANIESASELAGNSLKAPLDGNTIHIHHSLFGELKNVLDREDPQEKLATDVADHAEQLIFTQNNKHDQLNIGEVKFVKCVLKCDVALSKKDVMNSTAPTPDGGMAVGYHNGGIDIFTADGQLQQTVLKDINIRDIGFLSNGQYVVIDTVNDLTLYTQEQVKLNVKFETLSEDEGGIGHLTVDNNDLIYVNYWDAKKIQVFSPMGGKAIREIPCDGYEPGQVASYKDLLITRDHSTVRLIDKQGNVKHKVHFPTRYPYVTVTKNNSILIAGVNHDDGSVSIDEYTNELKHIKTLISNHKIEKTKRWWCYLQEFQSGEIAFCTTDRLYIFKLTITPINV